MPPTTTAPDSDRPVPDDVIPSGNLPPLTYRDLPDPIPLRKMLGPSIILAGLALGSGEFIFWPYLTYHSGFVFFWACLLGLATQYFLNMEITRWALATGETAITGFVRLNRHWAAVFLAMNVIPWMIPAWSKGAAQLVSWLIWGPTFEDGQLISPYETPLAIVGMIGCGVMLTAGPVVYETVERIQIFLVTTIVLMITVLAVWLLSGRPDAIAAQVHGAVTFGDLQFFPVGLAPVVLLGALAFAGAGGTTNLGQANYIKDKGYGMGRWIGRITSPITGQEEATSEFGYHFPDTPENRDRWRRWWRAAGTEHFISFFLTCLVCLVLLTLISYVLFFDAGGQKVAGAAQYQNDIGFVWGEAIALEDRLGGGAKFLFLIMGVAILLTTEFGVLDAASRISTDIVKVAWLADSKRFSESTLYYVFLWGTIALGSLILLVGEGTVKGSFFLFQMTAALNGGVMFLYSALLLYLNRFCLPPAIRIRGFRIAIMIWSVLFFGFFAVWAVYAHLVS